MKFLVLQKTIQIRISRTTFVLIVLAYSLTYCTNDLGLDSANYYNVPLLQDSILKNAVNGISIEDIYIDSTIESSFNGRMWVHNDCLYYSDLVYNYIFTFDPEGNLLNRYLGKGDGPEEIPGFIYTIPYQDGFLLSSGNNTNMYIFNSSWEIARIFKVNWQNRYSNRQLQRPNPKRITVYEFDIGIPNIIRQVGDDHIAVALTASHQSFHSYSRSNLYYNQSRILAIINCKTGKVKKLIGRRPPFFQSDKLLPNYDHFNFVLSEEKVLINFWFDPQIYVIDMANDTALGRFGNQGISMKLDYVSSFTHTEAEERRVSDITNYGIYHYMYFNKEENLILRGYTKGQGRNYDGLQIYKDYNLIGDINVPKGFEVIGLIKDYYYATMSTSKFENRISLLKFKLNYEN